MPSKQGPKQLFGNGSLNIKAQLNLVAETIVAQYFVYSLAML